MAQTFSFEEATGSDPERFVAPEVQAGRDSERARIVQAEFDNETDPATKAALGRELDRIGAAPGNAAATFSFEEAAGGKAPMSTFSFEDAMGPARPLPPGVAPSDAGAGRGKVNPPAVRPPRRGGTRAEMRPFVAEEPATPPLAEELGAVANEGARLRDTFFSGVDSAIAGTKTLNMGAQAAQLQKVREQLAGLEQAGRGASPEAEGLRKTIDHYAARLPRMAAGAAEAQADAQRGAAMVANPAVEAVTQAKTFGEAWEAFKRAPYDVISTITAQSLPTMLPALVAGAVAGPVVGATSMGASSAVTEAGSALGEYAREAGVDVTDPRALEAFFTDPKNLADAMAYAGKRAGIIGTLDAASGGVAGKVLAPAMRSGLARQAVNVPAQMGVQASMGAAGEAGAQLATKGRIDEPGQVLAEAVGEFGGAPAEVAALGREARQQAKPLRPIERRRAADDRLDDFAATHGLSSKALKAIKEAADGRPLDDVPAFYRRAIAAMAKRGLVGRQVTETDLAELDEPAPQQQPQQAATGLAEDAPAASEAIEAPELVAEPDAPTAPPAKGMVRYYHGGTGDRDVDGSLWFTSDLRDAQGWAARDPNGMRVWYTDVPEGDPARGGDSQFGVMPPSRMKLPAQYAGQMQPLREPPARTTDTRYQGEHDDGIRPALDQRADADGAPGPVDSGRDGRRPALPVRSGELAADDRLGRPAGQAASDEGADGLQPTQGAARGDALTGRVLALAGATRGDATPLELRPNADGSLTPYLRGASLIDYETQEPMRLDARMTDLAAKQAIRAARALSTKVNFFPAPASAAGSGQLDAVRPVGAIGAAPGPDIVKPPSGPSTERLSDQAPAPEGAAPREFRIPPAPARRQPSAAPMAANSGRQRALIALRDGIAEGGSLTTTIKKLGKALDPNDKAAVLDRSRELRMSGMSTREAAKRAVAEHIRVAAPNALLQQPTPDYTQTYDARRTAAPEGSPYAGASGEAAPGRPARAEPAADDAVRRTGEAVPRRGAQLRGLGIAERIERTGSAALLGQRVESADDLARLAQVYRDPRYETFRVFFVKGDVVVHATGVSARMPGYAPMIPEGMTQAQYVQWFRGMMSANGPVGADGYYLLHNHPSGNPTPSRADEMLTKYLAAQVPGLKGHVVINSGKYALISPEDDVQTRVLPIGKDALLTPSKPHPVLDQRITGPDDLVVIGKAVQRQGWLTAVGTTGAESRVRVIADVAPETLTRPSAVLLAMVRRLMRKSGSQSMFLVGSDADVASKPVQRALAEGVLVDAIGETGPTQSVRGVGGRPGVWPPPTGAARRVEATDAGGGDGSGRGSPPTDDAANAPGRALRTLSHYRGMALQALGRRQLVELYEGDLPQLRAYSDLVQQMDADKNDAGAQADTLARRWAKLKDETALARLMHDATLAGIDPAADDAKGELRNRFKALSKDAQAMYVEARDAYRDHFSQVEAALADRIRRTDMSSERRQKLLEHLADNFKELTEGVYFPLARFGDYVVIVRNAEGEAISVSRAETLTEADALRRSLVLQFKSEPGATVSKVLKDREFSPKSEGVSPGFLGELYEALEKEGVSADLMDDIGQLYLSSLPDLSWAKHGLHRKKTPGFSQDARRAFASYMFHGASYLARVRYADRLLGELDAMQKHVDAQGSDDAYDSVRAQQVVDEMAKRHDLLMNPRSHPISTALTSVGFVFHLGLSPASAMVNLAQTPLVAYPLAGAKWGYAPASAEFTKASTEIATHGGTLAKALQGDEADAYRRATRIGLIDVTLAHDLAGVAAGEDANVHRKLKPVMRAASWMFHHAERINREATFIAAYRLERKTGASAEAAFNTAVEFTYQSHFDYGASNRPRIMQGNWQRVILLFKQFAQNMVYLLARQAQQSLKAATPEARSEARKALAGLLVMHASAAGVLGLPLVSTLLAAASMIGSDDDEPWDAETALRNMLADAFGQKPAEVLARGVSRLTPWDISGRVGLDRLILPDVYEGLEGQRAVESWFASALGPVAGIAVNVGKGLQDIGKGDWLRGLEEMMPAALRGPLRAYRFATEGANDRSGAPILDEVDSSAIVGQVLGLSPSALRNAQEGRSAVIEADRALTERRSKLINAYARAEMGESDAALERADAAIDRWNDKQPDREITAGDLNRSIRARQRRIDQTEDGIYLPRSHEDAREAGRFARRRAEPEPDEETEAVEAGQ